MADKVLQSITFPNLSDRYTIPQIDSTLSESGKSADAKVAGDALATKAEIDGYYEEMTVGDAEQLVGTQFIEDSVPYLYRTSGGSADIGNREYDEIVGGSVVRNQLADVLDGTSSVAGTTVAKENGTIAVSGTATASSNYNINTVGIASNHVYILSNYPQKMPINSENANATLQLYLAGFSLSITENATSNYKMAKSAVDGSGTLRGRVQSGETYDLSYCPQLIDLTAKLGSTVADYVYSLEQATAGAGIAKLKEWGYLDDEYIPYDAGTMKSVEGLQSHDMVGFNQWDEEWRIGAYNSAGAFVTNYSFVCSKNPIRVLPNQTYSTSVTIYAWFYDSNMEFLESTASAIQAGRTFTIPSGAKYMHFRNTVTGTTYNNDICINLSWSGTRNGEYEPYVKHSYPLDSSLTLRGIPKLDASNNLYYDGDTYAADGTVTRKYGIVDLGTLNWTKYTVTEGTLFRAKLPLAKQTTGKFNAICSVYTVVAQPQRAEKTIYLGTATDNLDVIDSAYSDDVAFEQAMSGVMLVYELAIPTTEQATPYNEVQIVDDWGTEEYITDSVVPVGHNTRYPQNLRDKLQHLPNLASSDGFYLIQQTGTQMELVAFHIPKATGLADGTYTLKATVSDGTPTYTWEADTNE